MVILPENIDIDKADAQIDKGILTVKIPKNEISGNGKIGDRLSVGGGARFRVAGQVADYLGTVQVHITMLS